MTPITAPTIVRKRFNLVKHPGFVHREAIEVVYKRDINMPMHKHACTSTHIKGSVSCPTHPAKYGLHTHKREKQCVTGWNLSALTTAAPSLSCRKEQKKVRGRERRGKSLPCNIFGTPQVACNLLRHIQAIATVLAQKTKIFGLSLWASGSFLCS